MPRDPRAYLADIVDACLAIQEAVRHQSLESYRRNRLIRSSVEREFIIIGEALNSLSSRSSHTFGAIAHGRRIVDFRNLLTHAYSTVDDAIVWAIGKRDVPVLLQECKDLLEREPATSKRTPDTQTEMIE